MKLNWSAVSSIAKAHHMEDPTGSVESFTRFLKWWWCRTFTRPLKDPLLQQYTLNELCYEFLRYYYLNPENDPRKQLEAQTVVEDEEAWIKSMMAKIPPQKPLEPILKAEAPVATSEDQAIQDQLNSLANLGDISTKFDPES